MCFGSLGLTALCCVLLQETIEKTDAQGKLLPEMVSEEGGRGGRSVTLPALPAATAAAASVPDPASGRSPPPPRITQRQHCGDDMRRAGVHEQCAHDGARGRLVLLRKASR